MRHELIVVGVDGSHESQAALRFALEEAQRTGDAVEVVTAWAVEPLVGTIAYPGYGAPDLGEDVEKVAARQQADALVAVPEHLRSVSVATRLVHGDAGRVLVEAALTARMLVVGTRGYGPIRAALLGSVSRHCAHHATCPVVVVPGADSSATAHVEHTVVATTAVTQERT